MVCQKDRYIDPSSLNLVRATSATTKAKISTDDLGLSEKDQLTMRISHNCRASLGARPAQHEASKVDERFVVAFVLVLHLSKPLLEIFVDYKMYDRLTDTPVRSCHAFPKSSYSLRANKISVKAWFGSKSVKPYKLVVDLQNTLSNAEGLRSWWTIQLKPSLDQPNGVSERWGCKTWNGKKQKPFNDNEHY